MGLLSKKSLIFLFIIPILGGLVFSPLFLPLPKILADMTPTSVTVTISGPVCGDSIREGTEQCDGSDLGSQGCVSLGYTSGTLACYTAGMPNQCTFNTSGCVTRGSGGTGGTGGGRSGVYIPPVAVTKVIIQGKAYPSSLITVLQDGKAVTTVRADSLANFRVEIADITAGTYTFGLWGKDKEGRKSITSSFTVTVSKKGSTTISGILLPPTIELEKTSLQKGKILNILGQTGSQSEVSIFINSSAKEIIKRETKARTDGKWFYAFDTTILEEGSYTVQAKSLTSTFSQTLAFTIGEAGGKTGPKGADINKDGKVNLVDFSILLYNWNIPKNTMADLNYDGKVNLVDFSIMLYYWTG